MTTSFDVGLLEPLLKRAEETHSDAVVVMYQGELVGVWRFGKPKQLIQTMSVTKSVVNLVIGRLITKGLLTSIDEPICTFYPEWKQGRKRSITIKHIMNHTSGLQNVPNANEEIYPSPDVLQLALCAELSDEPGESVAYNNKAVNLLAGIVERISGKKLDTLMSEEIFFPLGITEFFWGKDSVGNPGVMAGLGLFPEDLAKLGQLVLNLGKWQGQQLIDASWFELSLTPTLPKAKRVGLLWWLEHDVSYTLEDSHITALRNANAPENVVEKLEQIKGIYTSESSLSSALKSIFGDMWSEARESLPKNVERFSVKYSDLYAYYAEGYLGQYLYVFPKEQLVFVRMISEESYQDDTDGFGDMNSFVRSVAQSL